MSHTFTVDVTRSLIAGLLIFSALVFPNLARGQKPIFTQDLEPFGFQTKPPSKGGDGRDLSSVTFLSDDLVLVAINKLKGPISLPARTTSQLATFLLFSLGENKLIRQEQRQMALFDGPIQATQDGHFLLPDGTGLRRCSAEFQCSEAVPLPGPVFVSPRGTTAVIGGIKDLTQYVGNTPVYKDSGQKLIDTATLSVLKVFTPDDPFVLPGDNGLLMLKGTKVSVVPPGEKERELEIEELYNPRAVRPNVRFLNDHDVVGFKGNMVGLLGESKVRATTLDGKVLVSIGVYNPALVHFSTSASGSRFCMHEAGDSGFNFLGHIWDDGHLHNFVKVQVFEVESGRKLFNLEWNPGPSAYGTVYILPALSPSGRRLALIRKGVLQVYEIP